MKLRNRLVLLLATIFVASFTARAEQTEQEWYLETDTEVSIPMSGVAFLLAADDDTHFSVVTVDNTSYDGITRATFAQHSTTGLGHVSVSDEIAVFPTMVNSTLNILGCKSGAAVQVVSLAGQTVISATVDGSDAAIDVSNLAPGCYLLKVGKQAVKFIKR